MDLRQLLNTQEEGRLKRTPLAELSTNRAPVERSKLNPTSETKVDEQPVKIEENALQREIPPMSTPLRPSTLRAPLTLPPISHLTNSIPVSHLMPSPVPNALPTPSTPATPSRESNQANSSNFLYGVQNSRKKGEMFFNITSADDFQKCSRVPDTESDRSMELSMDRSIQDSTGKRNRRKMLWSNEASVCAAEEFKRLYENKRSSSFLKKEYQRIAEKLNVRFGPGRFSETSVRNRKGFFQCLSHIFTSLRDHPEYNKFNDKYVPQLTDEQWKEASQYFEPSYLRKFRGKTDNTDLHIVCVIFKKRPMRKQEDAYDDGPDIDMSFRLEELQVVRRIVGLVQRGFITLEEVTSLFQQCDDNRWVELLFPLVREGDEAFLQAIRNNFTLNKNITKGVDLRRFWQMMNMTQNQ